MEKTNSVKRKRNRKTLYIPREEVLKMYDFYCDVKSITKTAREFKTCTKILSREFGALNLDYPLKDFNKKLKYNENYFKVIDTELKAYLLGFIYADGCITKRNRSETRIEKSFSINIHNKDLEILECLKSELEYSGKIRKKDKCNFESPENKKVYTRDIQYSIGISSTRFVENLENLGVKYRKTYEENSIPKIDESFISHFIRGYFDGDGCISESISSYTSKKGVNSYTKIIVNFTSKTKTILEEILLVTGIPFRLNYNNKRDVYTLTTTDKKNTLSFYHYLYRDATFSLSRKQLKYKNVLVKLGELLENPEMDNQQPS